MGPRITAANIHHVALRVVDAAASKAWFVKIFGMRVDGEFSFAGLDFVWLRAEGETLPVIELVGGGGLEPQPAPTEDAMSLLNRPGFTHVCFQVDDVENAVAALRSQDVRIIIDVIDGPSGSGVKKAAFFVDPAGNVFEVIQTISA
jgi:catechol 2,3-dioxygenase-like lactoylglutathione lyase family enzyme